MAKLVTNDEVPADAPPVVATFLEATSGLPTWANPEQLEAAARLFNINGFASLAVLVGASLPQCYTMRTGVRILALTSQLGAHSNRRLHQTAAMVLAVMGPGAFEPRGTGIRQTQKYGSSTLPSGTASSAPWVRAGLGPQPAPRYRSS